MPLTKQEFDKLMATNPEDPALEPYRVHDAVILAAGLSHRLSPIGYSVPKGLMPLHGELLVERLIRQLREAGVERISLVVGYLADQYRYLGEKYGVEFIYNDLYESRDISYSLACALDRLSACYVTYCDIYSADNPFRSHEYRAYYAFRPVAEHGDDPVGEWFADVTDDGAITAIRVDGEDPITEADTHYMFGHYYFDPAWGERLKPFFTEVLATGADTGEHSRAEDWWEWDWYHDVAAFPPMDERDYPCGMMEESDGVDEFVAHDPAFLRTVVSPDLDRICAALGCGRDDLSELYPADDERGPASHLRANGAEYLYRPDGSLEPLDGTKGAR